MLSLAKRLVKKIKCRTELWTAGLQLDQKHMLRGVCFASSITVEASLVLPAFILASVVLMYPAKVMDAERLSQIKLEEEAEALSEAAYLTYAWTGSGTSSAGPTGSAAGISGSSGAAQGTSSAAGTTGSASGTSTAADSVKNIILLDTVTPQFGVIGTRIVQASRRPWVGRSGGAGRNYTGDGPGEEAAEEPIVYITRNAVVSGAYHRVLTCSYLDKSDNVQEITMTEAVERGYHPCVRCG